MFRRKDEFDLDHDGGAQGSFLSGGAESETVTILSEQKAAEYKAENSAAPRTQPTTDVSTSQHGASFSSPSTFKQVARPIQPVESSARPVVFNAPSQEAAASAAPSQPSVLRPSTPLRQPSTDYAKFRSPEPSSMRSVQPQAHTSSAATPNLNQESSAMLNTKHNQNERVLTVGNDILLKGEITTCDRLVIEGNVDATVSEVNKMELAESGSFKGTAEVEYAEISGTFEGNLVVRGGLVIHRTGKVSGNISYGEIEIARGGSLTGEIKIIAAKSEGKISKAKEDKIAA